MVQLRRALLHLARLRAAAGDLLGALAVHQAARPRRGLPRQRLGHRQRRRPAHQDVHRDQRGGLPHHPPRARAQLLPARLQPAAARSSATAPTTASTRRIGDTIALSVTPEYLKQIGLIDNGAGAGRRHRAPAAAWRSTRSRSCRSACSIDQWRWKVFSGEITPAELQPGLVGAAREVPGRGAAGRRAARPTSIPAPSTTCRATRPTRATSWPTSCSSSSTARCAARPGYTGPLHRCSIYGNKEAGEKLDKMLAMGQSQPWPEALEALDRREADGRHRDPRLLRAAQDLARRAEQGPEVRLVTAAG